MMNGDDPRRRRVPPQAPGRPGARPPEPGMRRPPADPGGHPAPGERPRGPEPDPRRRGPAPGPTDRRYPADDPRTRRPPPAVPIPGNSVLVRRLGAVTPVIPPSRSSAVPTARPACAKTGAVESDRSSRARSSRRRCCIVTAASRRRRWPGRRYPTPTGRPRGTAGPCANRSPPAIPLTPPPDIHVPHRPMRRRRSPSRSGRTMPRAGVAMFRRPRRAGRRAVPDERRAHRGRSANGICSGGSW